MIKFIVDVKEEGSEDEKYKTEKEEKEEEGERMKKRKIGKGEG
jgi:hypothetical protein